MGLITLRSLKITCGKFVRNVHNHKNFHACAIESRGFLNTLTYTKKKEKKEKKTDIERRMESYQNNAQSTHKSPKYLE